MYLPYSMQNVMYEQQLSDAACATGRRGPRGQPPPGPREPRACGQAADQARPVGEAPRGPAALACPARARPAARPTR
jgi:hypothetical protein